MAWLGRGRNRRESDDAAVDERDVDQSISDLSQTHSDADQTASDSDASGSASDSAGSQEDQLGSDADQRASDADQASSDRELASDRDPSAARIDVHVESREERAEATEARRITQTTRTNAELERIRTDTTRALTAGVRDDVAAERDRVAEVRDGVALRAAAALLAEHPGNDPLREVVAASADLRDHANADRRRAAADRQRAAEDRLTAAASQRQARIDVQRAQLDGEAGVYARELGHATLRGEIDRCRRGSDPFVLALIRIDRSKPGNAHAGAELVDAVVGALRATLRSYDPVVRVGDDEFLCGLPGTNSEAAQERVDEIRLAAQDGHPPGTISVGFAVLGPGDTLGSLIDRAAADLPNR